MPVIKPIISGTSVRNATIVPIIAEEDLLIGDPVALFYKPNEYYEVPYERVGAGRLSRCAFSPDNNLLALYDYGEAGRWPVIYDVSSGEALPTPETVLEEDDYANECVFSPDGKQFAIACYNKSAVYLYDATTRPFTLQAKLSGCHQATLAYNRSGTRLCTMYSGSGSTLSSSGFGIYDTKTFTKLTNPVGFGYSDSNVNIRAVAYSPDDSQMAIQYDVYEDDSWTHRIGIFDNRGLTPTQVAYYEGSTNSYPLGSIFYSPDGTQIYNYYSGNSASDYSIFNVTPTSIEKANPAVGSITAQSSPVFLPTEQIAVDLDGYADFDNDAEATEDVVIGTVSLSSSYVYEYSVKTIASGTEAYHRHLSASPDGSLIFVSYTLDDMSNPYTMRVYKMEWFAKKANYKTQQFAQAIGYAMNNIKAGQAGSATRII